jgi:hypothetical protein
MGVTTGRQGFADVLPQRDEVALFVEVECCHQLCLL